MRRAVLFVLAFFSMSAFAQSGDPDEALLAKTRALYDTPFRSGLILFDCEIQFDWKQHFIDLLGTVPPAAAPLIEHLQPIPHRVLVDRSGAIVSAEPTKPDLSGVPHAKELEQGFNAIAAAGLNAWLPFSMDEILPVGPTKYHFDKTAAGYRLTLNGPGVSATLLLNNALYITGGTSATPQRTQFVTEFDPASNGLVLTSLSTTPDNSGEAKFFYTYAQVNGFQIPSTVTVTSAARETWKYSLTGCKTSHGVMVKNLPVVPK